ncbi:MAG: polysaccharide deacetylase family protein [Candidatus Saccharibacteria bacterium]
MVKKKVKVKAKSHDGKKRPFYSRLSHHIQRVKTALGKLTRLSRRKKYWLLSILIIPIAGLVWCLSQTWVVKTSFSQAITYPKVSVLGKNLGGLDVNKLNNQLTQIKSDFEARKVTLVNGKSKWVFDTNKLGVTFDIKSTSQAVLHLNKLNPVDKYRLLTGSISPVIAPTIKFNNDTCIKALSIIPTVQVNPTDALVYFDTVAKIKPDQAGSKFNAISTCKELPNRLANNSFVASVSLDIIPANLTKSDLESKIPQIQSMVGEALILKSSNYQQTLTPQQLFALLDIAKVSSSVGVNWSSDRLDNVVNDIATKVNTYNSTPALGACQYISSSGGYWLDKAATKKIFTDLVAGKPRSYDLPIAFHALSIGNRTPVAPGGRGTIYLTFDDGMTYADRIMNYAACYGVKVTFFEIGERVGTDAVALRRAITEGHAVQSHGHYHAIYDYGSRSYDWQNNDMNQSIIDIMSVTGVRPTYFRPPGGNRSNLTYQAVAANSLKLILWDDASADATVGGISSATTCANVLAGAYPGASVLMHSTKYSTAEAVPCIIEGLAARGYNMQALR